MATFAPSGAPQNQTITVNDASNPTIANVAMAAANTEYSYALPVNTRRFYIKPRNTANLQLAYISGNSGTLYVTVNHGTFWLEENINTTGVILYFQSSVAGNVAEIVSWS